MLCQFLVYIKVIYYTYICFFNVRFHYVYCSILNIVPCAVLLVLVAYLVFISNLYLLIPNS